MAAILTVGYTPNYAGNHRICFKTTGDTYCCYNDDSASVIGVQKSIDIVLDDFELCLGTLPASVGCAGSEVDGYVQPTCVDQTSDINRFPFIATFNTVACNAYKIICEESGIVEITVTEQGIGWLPGDVPTVTITDNSGYGSGATAEAVMACNDANICYVESITVVDVGEFYYFPDQISVDISLPTDPGGTPATAQVTAVDNCDTYTIPNCDGTDNPTEYQLWGGSQYAVNVCSGGAGPNAPKYTVIPNPSEPGPLGDNILLNPDFLTSVDDWGNPESSVVWSSDFGGSANFQAYDSVISISQDVLTIGQEYAVEIDLTIIFDGSCTPELEAFTSFTIYAGSTSYGPLSFSDTQSFSFNITCTDNPTFKIEAWDPEGCTSNELLGPQMYCSYVSVRALGAPIPVSCCECVKYDLINYDVNSLDVYYTDCIDQVVKTQTIDPAGTAQVCAVRKSIFPVNPDHNQFFEYIESEGQDC